MVNESNILHYLSTHDIINIEDIHDYLDDLINEKILNEIIADKLLVEFQDILYTVYKIIVEHSLSETGLSLIQLRLSCFSDFDKALFFSKLYDKTYHFFKSVKAEMLKLSGEDIIRGHLISLIMGAWDKKEEVFKLFITKKFELFDIDQKYIYDFARIFFEEVSYSEYDFLFVKDYLFIYKTDDVSEIVDKLKKIISQKNNKNVIRRRKKV